MKSLEKFEEKSGKKSILQTDATIKKEKIRINIGHQRCRRDAGLQILPECEWKLLFHFVEVELTSAPSIAETQKSLVVRASKLRMEA